MEYSRFSLEGPLLITTDRHPDIRGFFSEYYQQAKYSELGIPNFLQDNISLSAKGVFRGLHWQEYPHSQGKLVSCLVGKIVDFFVDIRPGSPTYLQYDSVVLSGENPKSLWVPEGFAHGFLSLEDETLVHYKVTNYWEPSAERSLTFEHLDLSDWIDLTELIVSDKDLMAPKSL